MFFSSQLQTLCRAWRTEAASLERWPNNEGTVAALLLAAEMLETTIEKLESEVLTLDQAAAESGYSPDHLGRLLRENPELNAGEKYRPRIRRGDLRMKHGHRPDGSLANEGEPSDDLNRLFRDIVDTKFGG